MKIGIDIDEVLADFMGSFLKYYNKTYNTELKRTDFKEYSLWSTLGGTKKESGDILDGFFRTKDFELVDVVEGAQGGIKTLSKDNDLIVITARPIETYNKTVDWLDKNFPNKFSSIEFSKDWDEDKNSRWNKKDICLEKNIDVLFEDNLVYAKECSESEIDVKLFDCPWNQIDILPEKITRIYSWNDAIGSLTRPYSK